MSEVADKPDLAAIVEKYMLLREKKAQLKAEFDTKTEAITAAMDRCETYLLTTMNALGVDSVKTPFGTPYIKVATSASVADWPLLLDWIKKGDHWPMLEKRVSKTVVESYKAEHNDLPPGLNWTETRVLNIRKS